MARAENNGLQIDSFTPTTGSPGDEVTVTMTGNVDGNPSVVFASVGGKDVPYTSVERRTIRFPIPNDAPTGYIRIHRNGSSFDGSTIDAQSSTELLVIRQVGGPDAGGAPVLSGFTKNPVAPLTLVGIRGQNLLAITRINLNMTRLPTNPRHSGATMVSFTVPEGTEPGRYSVSGFTSDGKPYRCKQVLEVIKPDE